ncbi:response regulator transcription factor [Evansella sp. AB-rgal1]|uniref:response regulator transcription factor n=1 Tax=Evansella sp. AB-rgal1 TaxID=3242696 RepID=UPI00359D26B5
MKLLVGIEHELLRNGLIQLLKDVEPIEYMTLVSSTEEFIEAARTYHFDMVIIDVNIRGAGGWRSIVTILELFPPSAKKLFMYNEKQREIEELYRRREIEGLFYEKASLEQLMDFFQRILEGERLYLSSDTQSGNSIEGSHEGFDLTKREEEVFYMKVRGYTVKDTAKILKISPKTVENHRRNIRKKLHIQTNSEWFVWGKRLGAL